MKNTKEMLMLEDLESFATATKDNQKKEAVKRLRMLIERFDLDPQILRHWEEGNLLCTFEDGSLALADSFPQYFELIKKFEQQYNCLVYHAVKSGTHLSLLFVDEYVQDWPFFAQEELPAGHVIAYVHNLKYSPFSDMGGIRLSSKAGALVRIG